MKKNITLSCVMISVLLPIALIFNQNAGSSLFGVSYEFLTGFSSGLLLVASTALILTLAKAQNQS